jgi:hypothetical protein
MLEPPPNPRLITRLNGGDHATAGLPHMVTARAHAWLRTVPWSTSAGFGHGPFPRGEVVGRLWLGTDEV